MWDLLHGGRWMMWPFAAAICTVVVPSFKKLTNFSSHSLLRQPAETETETAPRWSSHAG